MLAIELLTEQLTEIGLNAVDGKIYGYLLNKQPKTVLEISSDLHIPRPTVYDSSLRLIKKGFIEKIVDYKSQKFRAFPLTLLQDMLNHEKEKIARMQENLTYVENALSQQTKTYTTQLRHYSGTQGFRQMMWNSLAAKKEMIGYSEFGRIKIVGKKFLQSWYEEINRKNLKDRVITTPQHIQNFYTSDHDAAIAYEKFQIRRFVDEKEIYITGDTMIYNNVFALCYWKHGEVIGVEIENEEFVKNQRSIFEKLWIQASPDNKSR